MYKAILSIFIKNIFEVSKDFFLIKNTEYFCKSNVNANHKPTTSAIKVKWLASDLQFVYELMSHELQISFGLNE